MPGLAHHRDEGEARPEEQAGPDEHRRRTETVAEASREDREQAHDERGKRDGAGKEGPRPAELFLEDVEEDPEREEQPDHRELREARAEDDEIPRIHCPVPALLRSRSGDTPSGGTPFRRQPLRRHPAPDPADGRASEGKRPGGRMDAARAGSPALPPRRRNATRGLDARPGPPRHCGHRSQVDRFGREPTSHDTDRLLARTPPPRKDDPR